jgi:hypothetical protein
MEKTLIELREEEIAQYEANIALYTSIASKLPSEWPKNLVHLKNSSNKHSDIATIEDLDEVTLVSDLWAHDEALASVRAETVEMRKAMAILEALKA